MKKLTQRIFKFTLISLTLLLLCWVMEPEVANLETQQYCDMVKLYKDSNSENGWPDYNNNYEKECKE